MEGQHGYQMLFTFSSEMFARRKRSKWQMLTCEFQRQQSIDTRICKSKMQFESLCKHLKPTNNLPKAITEPWMRRSFVVHQESNEGSSWERKPFKALSSSCLWIELVASLHYTFSVLQKIELQHPLSSETLLILRSDQSMAMNNDVSGSTLKWPQIFISAPRQQYREKGSESLGLSVSTLMYHMAQWVLTVQLGALLRPSLSVGQTSRELGKIKSCFLKYTSGATAINLATVTAGGQRSRTPAESGPNSGRLIHPYQPD